MTTTLRGKAQCAGKRPGSSEYAERLGDQGRAPAFDPPAGSRNALERSPSLTAQLHEEQIRFILLVSLNAVFEGLAGGEVFNHKGKTDILIRMENTNVSSASA